MMTLNKKQPLIKNDINPHHLNKTSLLTIIGVITTFLITLQLMVIP